MEKVIHTLFVLLDKINYKDRRNAHIKILSIAIVSSTAIFSMSEEDTVGNTTNHAIVAPVAINRELAANIEAFLAANPNGTPSMANLAAFAEARNNGVDLAAPALPIRAPARWHPSEVGLVTLSRWLDVFPLVAARFGASPAGRPRRDSCCSSGAAQEAGASG